MRAPLSFVASCLVAISFFGGQPGQARPERCSARPRVRDVMRSMRTSNECCTTEPVSQCLEAVDIPQLAGVLRRACGPSVVGAAIGRARLQDEVTRHLGCSAQTAEALLGTMISRGVIRQEVHRDGWVHWVITAG
jgi:hypothetical protein